MSLGWKFYVKYLTVLIPLCLMMLLTIFMPKDKAIKFTLENKLTNRLTEWVWK